MIDPIDLQGLLGWLRSRGGDTTLLSYVARDLRGKTPALPARLPREDRELVLEGLLYQCCDPRVDERRLDGLARVARALGFEDDGLGTLISDRLGITERRLRAYGVLGVSLDATPDEIKKTHRAIAKALHPDRLSRADAEAREQAGRLLARLNAARTVLLSPRDEVALDRPDDVGLDEPWFDEEDAPTEVDLTELLERIYARPDDDVDLSDPIDECR